MISVLPSILQTLIAVVAMEDGCGFGPYVLTPQPMTWQDAEDYAVGLGGHLVAIGSAEEENAITTFVLSNAPGEAWWWIGLSDASAEGEWRWTNGEPVVYTAWHLGEPNDVAQPCRDTGEDFARGTSNGWYDWSSPLTSCRESLAIGVVELPGPAVYPDRNGDGLVNGQDLALILGFWGLCPPGCPGDADCSGAVDGLDLAIVLGGWTG